jgi:selenide,water dikinase
LSGGCNRGKAWLADRVRVEASADRARADLFFDAETSGGLLLAVAESVAEVVIRRLQEAGAPSHSVVGRFAARPVDAPFVVVS